MATYYNEMDPFAAQWLRNLIAAGHLPAGEVDERSILDVRPIDLRGFVQCHFFAGIGGWPHAARLAGLSDERPIWTGSAPCQPFSIAGRGRGADDERHLWPHFFSLISASRPAVIMGEQVAAAIGKNWFDGVSADLESIGYTCRAAVVPACAVNAPHRRDRLWFVADAKGAGTGMAPRDAPDGRRRRSENQPAGVRPDDGGASDLGADAGRGIDGFMADTGGERRQRREGATERGDDDWPHAGRIQGGSGPFGGGEADGAAGNAWASPGHIVGTDGKARRVKPGIRLLAHGVPGRVGRLRAYGNAIVPQVAAEIIGAWMDVRGILPTLSDAASKDRADLGR